MLETIRKSTKSTYILLLFGAIILVFVFWGIGPGGRGRSANAVATVNGEPIDMKDYLALHKRLTDYYRNILKDKFTPSVEKGLNLKKNAVAILIDRRLAVMDAENKGIGVSKKEVQDSIGSMAAFQTDGVFSNARYLSALRSERIKPDEFEDDVRKDLLVEKMRAGVVKDVSVSEEDIRKAYLKENRELDLAYVAVNAADKMGDIEVTDKEGKQYLMDHSTDFVLPAKIKVLYGYAAYDAFKKRASVSESEIKAYYEKNQGHFTEPEKIHARHILIRPDMKNKDRGAAKKAAVEKARKILARVKAGEDFSALARKYSSDPGSAKKGGDLGWFPKGVMMKTFEEAAFALKKGEVSDVVETPFGAHIIRLEGRKPASVKPLSEARGSIKAELSKDLSDKKAFDAIKALEDPLKEAGDLKALKGALKGANGLVLHETAFFDSKHFDKSLEKAGRLKDSLFLMNEGEISEPVKTYEGIYLVKVVKREDARIPEYDEVKADVKERVAAGKALRLAKKEAKELLKAVKGGKSLKDAAKAKGLKVRATGLFSMSNGFIPGIGLPVRSYGALFELDSAKPVYKKTIRSSGSFYVVVWKASKEADLSNLTDDKRASLTETLNSSKKDDKINKWLDSLRKKAKIQVFEDRM